MLSSFVRFLASRPRPRSFKPFCLQTDGLSASQARSPRLVSANLDTEKRQFIVKAEDKTSYRLPFAFAWEQSSLSSLRKRRFDATPTYIKISSDSSGVSIQWSSGERSEFTADWLSRIFVGESKVEKLFQQSVEKQYWRSDYSSAILEYNFQRLLDEDAYLVDFVSKMESHGLVVVNGAKKESGQLQLLGKRMGGTKCTNYGELMTVSSQDQPSHLAYTNDRLDLHVDLLYMNYPPEWQVFHCIDQISGPVAGAGWYCDGFAVASHFKQEYPEAFHLLSTHKCHLLNIGSDYIDYSYVAWHPVLKLNQHGQLERVFLNNHIRGNQFSVELKDHLFDWYAAYYRLMHLAHDPQFLIHVKLEPGQILLFDNLRVLHGRPAFEQKNGEVRHLELVYLDRDPMYAKIRSL